jgi:membrane protein DedA with SNARE-associated domain
MSVLAVTSSDQGGITGFLLDLIETLGPVGVGMTIFIETVVPPIPSEVVLSAAGVLINDGRMALVPVIIFATLGSVLGAAVLYQVGRSLGPRRSHAFLDRLPLVKTEDVDRTFEWFERHGRPAVFFGRMVPIVRSFVSVPAGVVKMPWAQFLAYTTAGSLIWNSLLIGLGVALGDVVNDYLQYFDYVIYLAVVAVVAWFVYRAVKEKITQGDVEPDRSAADRILEADRRREEDDR